jgi:hypothetical protein
MKTEEKENEERRTKNEEEEEVRRGRREEEERKKEKEEEEEEENEEKEENGKKRERRGRKKRKICDSFFTIVIVHYIITHSDEPFSDRPDPTKLDTFILNLDLAPNQRWNEMCSALSFIQQAQYLIDTVTSLLPGQGKYLAELGREILNLLPTEYAQEIEGCATSASIDRGWLALMNLAYELADACTSIVAQTMDGQILHARNLDFGDGNVKEEGEEKKGGTAVVVYILSFYSLPKGLGFTNILRNLSMELNVIKHGQTLFRSVGFPSYVGVLR